METRGNRWVPSPLPKSAKRASPNEAVSALATPGQEPVRIQRAGPTRRLRGNMRVAQDVPLQGKPVSPTPASTEVLAYKSVASQRPPSWSCSKRRLIGHSRCSILLHSTRFEAPEPAETAALGVPPLRTGSAGAVIVASVGAARTGDGSVASRCTSDGGNRPRRTGRLSSGRWPRILARQRLSAMGGRRDAPERVFPR